MFVSFLKLNYIKIRVYSEKKLNFFLSPFYLALSFYFHSSLFLSPRNSDSPSHARDSSATFFFRPLPRHGFPSPSKQPPPTDKTRVVNSTRRKPTHLSLSTTHPLREPRDLEILMTIVRSFSATLDYWNHWFLIFFSKFKLSWSFFVVFKPNMIWINTDHIVWISFFSGLIPFLSLYTSD